MPIYQYKCKNCNHSMEALQKMSDPLLLTCPACGEDGLKKQLTAAAFKLKGTGWYATDFKNSGKPSAPPAAKEDSSGLSLATPTSSSSDAPTVTAATQDTSSKNAPSKDSSSTTASK